MKLNLIYSESNLGIMGINNDLYCKLKPDLKMFQKITSTQINNKKNVIIMGFNTWKSIKKPLKDRINIVISNQHYNELERYDVHCFQCITKCFKYLEEIEYGKIFIIGGAYLLNHIFENHYHSIDLIYQTKILEKENVKPSILCNITYNKFSLENDKKIQLLKEKNNKGDGFIYNFEKRDYIQKEINYCENVYQKIDQINSQEAQYLELLRDILNNGKKKESRNSIVYSNFGSRMKFDLRNGFPLLTTKKMPWKTILRELLWFIEGSTDNKQLQDKNVHIWNATASKEFLESRNLNYEEGDLGPIYGFQWRHFGAEYNGPTKDYSGQGIDQLQWVINEIKKNPTSRRLIMSAWNPVDLDKMALPPCHIMVQFNIENEYIDAQLYQRSGDLFLGVPFNISSYSFLLTIVGKLTGYTPRYFIHIIGDTHIYENHIDAVNEQLKRIPCRFPTLDINDIESIDQLKEEDLKIINYNCSSTIKAEMIA